MFVRLPALEQNTMGVPRARAAGCLARMLASCVLAAAFVVPASAQTRPSTLSPGRDTAPPGATLRIAVNPALAAEQPAGSQLVLRSAQGRRGPADVALRIVDWSGQSIRAVIPRDAPIASGALRMILLDRRNEVIADSGNRMLRLVAAGEIPSEGRAAGGDAGSRTGTPADGPAARVPGSPGPEAGYRGVRPDRRGGATAPDVSGTLPGADPRTGREVEPGRGTLTTPGVFARAREAEPAANGAATRSARSAADFVVIGDESRTITDGQRATYPFNLPADAPPVGRAVLFYVVNPDSPPGGVNASVSIYLNGSEVRSHSYSDGMVRTMFETLDARGALRPGANHLEFRARGNPTKISDIVLMYHWHDQADAPASPAKSARSGDTPPVVRR